MGPPGLAGEGGEGVRRRRQARRGAGGWRGRCACQVGCPPGGCVGPGTERPRLPGLAQFLQACRADPTRWAWVCRSASRQDQSVCRPQIPSTPYHSHGNHRLPRRPSSFPLVSGLRPPGARGPRQPLTHPRAGRPPRGRCRWPRRWAARPSRCR